MAELSKKPPFNREPGSPDYGKDSDPKGTRDIKPVSPKERSGKDDKSNRQPMHLTDVSGAYPQKAIDKAYASAAKVSRTHEAPHGQGGPEDL